MLECVNVVVTDTLSVFPLGYYLPALKALLCLIVKLANLR